MLIQMTTLINCRLVYVALNAFKALNGCHRNKLRAFHECKINDYIFQLSAWSESEILNLPNNIISPLIFDLIKHSAHSIPSRCPKKATNYQVL